MTSALRRFLVVWSVAAMCSLLACASAGAVSFFVDHRQHQQQHGTTHRHPAQPRVEDEHHGDIDGQPGCIEEGEQAAAGKELAQAGQVIERLRRGIHPAAVQRTLEAGLVDLATEQHIQPRAHPHQDARAYPLQRAKRDHQQAHDQRQHGQRGQAAAGDHPTVHLQHVEGRHQHQRIDEQAEETHEQKALAAGLQRVSKVLLRIAVHGTLCGRGRSEWSLDHGKSRRAANGHTTSGAARRS